MKLVIFRVMKWKYFLKTSTLRRKMIRVAHTKPFIAKVIYSYNRDQSKIRKIICDQNDTLARTEIIFL